MKDKGMFDIEAVRACQLDTIFKKIWGAWQVLCGRAGIILLDIKAKRIL